MCSSDLHQIATLTSGGRLVQETRRWDEPAGITETMRTKEEAHDYRYFPEPDLMPLEPSAEWIAEVRTRLIELPLEKKRRLMSQYSLPASDADTFVHDPPLSRYFEAGAAQAKNPKALANWVINNLRAQMAETQTAIEEVKFAPSAILELVDLVDTGKISGKIAQEVFAEMFASGEPPERIVNRKGLVQVSDTGAIERFCDEAIAANPRSVADYRAGKGAALNFLKGQVMQLSKGKANPGLAGQVLEQKLAKIG